MSDQSRLLRGRPRTPSPSPASSSPNAEQRHSRHDQRLRRPRLPIQCGDVQETPWLDEADETPARAVTEPKDADLADSGLPVETTAQHGGKTSRGELLEALQLRLEVPEPASITSSPVSPTSLWSSDGGWNETPATSPESSPRKVKPQLRQIQALGPLLFSLDRDRDGCSESAETRLLDNGTDNGDGLGVTFKLPIPQGEDTVADVQQHNDLEQTSNVMDTPRIQRSTAVAGHKAVAEAAQNASDQATPLGPASPAKPPAGFPFPRQSEALDASPSRPISRHPSTFLSSSDRTSTRTRRRYFSTGLHSPDRFIPNRILTPLKESLLLPASTSQQSSRPKSLQPVLLEDPFDPLPRRRQRLAEQYATLRSPTPPLRPVGRSYSSVHQPPAHNRGDERAIWTVGGTDVTEGVASVSDGRGGRVTSGTTAPHYTADFLRKASRSEEEIAHGRRLAFAMDMDQTSRVLDYSSLSRLASPASSSNSTTFSRVWRDSRWDYDHKTTPTRKPAPRPRDLPNVPFRVLDAPALRDDYYCSLLSYCATLQCLAVGLGPHVYLWSEAKDGPRTGLPDSLMAPHASHVTSISFSSTEGRSAILAIGRANGRITLWSPIDRDPRFDSEQPAPVSAVCFRPVPVKRPSVRDATITVNTEELLVGDELGHVYFYSVEWPTKDQRDLYDWHGSMVLLARLSCHTQQVCGLAWNIDGSHFASGGNDNQLFLFETKKILNPPAHAQKPPTVTVQDASLTNTTPPPPVLDIVPGQQKQVFTLNAAVKAIAFAPWQSSLLAAGGGSNDRCIHFFHTVSGAKLATIDCHAQVTSLVWSARRKHIAATLGFAQPEHPYRVAVFSWPWCRMVVGIPWWSEERALYAVAYPRGPAGGVSDDGGKDGERSRKGKLARDEGCLVVATSDASIKFHEIWPEISRAGREASAVGVLGGSQILEGECSAGVERREAIR